MMGGLSLDRDCRSVQLSGAAELASTRNRGHEAGREEGLANDEALAVGGADVVVCEPLHQRPPLEGARVLAEVGPVRVPPHPDFWVDNS